MAKRPILDIWHGSEYASGRHRNLTLAADVFNARLAQANLITKTDSDAKLSSLNRNITTNKTKYLLVENELKKIKTFDSIYLKGTLKMVCKII